MSEVRLGEHEAIEPALRRFKQKIPKAGILSEIKGRERDEQTSLSRQRQESTSRKRR